MIAVERSVFLGEAFPATTRLLTTTLTCRASDLAPGRRVSRADHRQRVGHRRGRTRCHRSRPEDAQGCQHVWSADLSRDLTGNALRTLLAL
jgi:hypothetical protein